MKKKSILLLISFVFILNTAFAQQMKYSRVKMQMQPEEIINLAKLGFALDDGVRYEKGVLTGEFSENDIKKLDENGYQYEILIEDLLAYYLNRIKNSGTVKRTKETPENFNLGSMGGNLTLSEMLAELDDMRNLFPNLISVKQEITTEYTTHDGNYVYWVRISDNPDVDEDDEPEVLYTSLHHAREPVSMMQLVYQMWYMLENYEAGSESEYLINNFEMYFVLCQNPDGYLYNESTYPGGGGMWRKNRRNNGGSYGVDPNRNYPYMWGYDNSGSSGTPSSETYRGPSAGSEPITQMIMEFVGDHEFLICDNHHTYSNLLIIPWGYDEIEGPHEEIFDAYSDIMTRENGYTTGHGWEILYVVNGDACDWMYGEHEILAFTSETGDEFWPDPSDIIPLCEGNLEMNLFQTRLAGMYADVSDLTDNIVPAHGYINLDIHFLGLDTLGTFSVYITSNDFAQIGDTVFFSDYHKLEHAQDSIFYQVNESLGIGDEFTFTLYVDNGMYAYTTEITKTIGKVDVIFEDPGNNINNWTSSQWSATNEDYHSASSSITDSEGGDYSSYANNPITLTNPIDLSSYSSADVSFWGKWDIENNWDYVQFFISTNGGSSWTVLEGEYTNPGSPNQPTGQPLYDGSSSWVNEVISLDSYLQNNIKFKFVLVSDGYIEADGYYFDDFSIISLNETNIIPVIKGQEVLHTYENTAVEITLGDLTVEDDDSTYPDDFALLLFGGDNYTVDGTVITPDTDFSGILTVPVKVNDGYDYSESFDFEITVSGTNDINTIENNISLFPNPVKNELNITLDNTYYRKIQIIDITGKILTEKNINNSKNINISTSKFQAGIYFCKLFGDNIIIRKFVIEK
ncbi:MAG: immune inhibitor A [Bacteroidales bacterium]|nr:immune inhibitor A [Bacteroidales bacterium]